MNEEVRNNQNEETQLEMDAQVNDASAADVVENAEAGAQKQKSSGKRSVAGTAAAGAAAGAALGVGGMSILTGFATPPEVINNPDTTSAFVAPDVADFDGVEVPIAEGIDDTMTFAEAFSTARQDVGAGGVFFWRGGCYNTFYANEWEALSDDYKETFSGYAYEAVQDQAANMADGGEEAPAGEADLPEDDMLVEEDALPDSIDSLEEVDEVEVLSIDMEVGYTDIDGQEVAYAPVYVDGQDGVVIDLDGDGIFDVVAIDNGTDTPDVYDISEENLTYGDVAEPCELDDYGCSADGLADYVNDAPIDDFVG